MVPKNVSRMKYEFFDFGKYRARKLLLHDLDRCQVVEECCCKRAQARKKWKNKNGAKNHKESAN